MTDPTITYRLEYDHSDIVVSFSDSARVVVEGLIANKSADGEPLFTPGQLNGFRDSIEYFCREFYPHMLSSDSDPPWKLHKAAGSNQRNLNALIKKATHRWPLAWYWKALFTGFSGLLEGNGRKKFGNATIVVRIVQVRQWVLALVYREQEGKQYLLRPPLFGYSERIANWDQYLALLQHTKRISEEWKAAETGTWPGADTDFRRHEEKYYVLGRHDMEYRFKPSSIVATSPTTLEIPVSFRIELNPHIKKFDHDDVKKNFEWVEDITGEAAFSDVEKKIYYPYDVVEIPIFQDSTGSRENTRKSERILLASDAVCRAYESLSEIWNDKMARCVLIIAPPGSGKELLARSIHQFQNRPNGRLVSYALSPSSDSANERMLYSRSFTLSPHEESLEDHVKIERKKKRAAAAVETDNWLIAGTDVELEKTDPYKNDVQNKDKRRPIMLPDDGLIFKARKGVLFLDEIDKVSDGTRAGLLRLLENGEFALFETPMVLGLKKWRPLYVFAGSMGRDEMFKKNPPDFWTRMSHLVEMDHPLDVETDVEMKRIARSYFWFFWVEKLAEFFAKTELLPFPYEEPQDVPKGISAGEKAGIEKQNAQVVLQKEFFQNYFALVFKILNDCSIIDYLASTFAIELSEGGRIHRFSIRNIRNIASLVRFSLMDFLLYNKRQNSALRKIRKKITLGGIPAVEAPVQKEAEGVVKITTKADESLYVRPLHWFEAIKHAIVGSGELVVYDKKKKETERIKGKECEELRNEIRKIVGLSLRKVFL